MPEIASVLKLAGLHVQDAHGDRLQLIQPAAEHASARVGLPAMQVRPTYAVVVAAELQTDLRVGPARHDRVREYVQVDGEFVAVSLRFRDHAAEQLQEVQ